MSTEKKRKEEFHKALNMSRRSFLGGAGVLAASAAFVNLQGMRNDAQAATGSVSPHRPERYGDAHVKYVPTTETNLGTTRIVGPIRQVHEAEHTFNKAILGEYGPQVRADRMRLVSKNPLGGALFTNLNYISGEHVVDGPPAPNKLAIPDPERMSKHIKELGLFLRADDVGIGLMRHHATYLSMLKTVRNEDGSSSMINVPVDTSHHKYVIAVILDQDLRTTLGSTGYDGISIVQSFKSYISTALIGVIIADYIRKLGYSARSHQTQNCNMIMAPNLISAGMGEMGRPEGCVMHPRFGFRFKAAIVSTDLPLVPDTPIEFGAAEFCRTCMKCAMECPAKAISTNKEQDEHNGYLRWTGDITKCALFRIQNQEGASCGRCMKVCPWNNKEDSWFHSMGLQMTGRFPAGNNMLKTIDDMFGYGTEQIDEFKWWLEWPDLYKSPKV